ncbi:MAG: DNA mismatch endonuclease Vsr [Gammaproteobacteria bacterium]|nr:DNA mismatch endonuclease Vsr [Gammaproteobacteria bacterium]
MTETREHRSRVMRAVKSRDTKPEMLVRRTVHGMGYRYRLHRKDLPGKPDLVFPKRRKAIFVHGCFWHGHDCPRGARMPKSNRSYWQKKIGRNKDRDAKSLSEMARQGWSVLTVWECQMRDERALHSRLRRFLEAGNS